VPRFAQPDTIVAGLRDPQHLNRYSYVRNNPISRSDPTGHCDTQALLNGCGGDRGEDLPDQQRDCLANGRNCPPSIFEVPRPPSVDRQDPGSLGVSPDLIGYLQRPENEDVRLDYYLDPAGICTVGSGHVVSGSCPLGETITLERASELFAQDLVIFEDEIRNQVTVPLSQNEFDALVSLVFNIGGTNFADSTTRRELNVGNRVAAADGFLLWTKAQDPNSGQLVDLPGLVRRRQEEREIFLTGAYPR
jgi:lysozyme